MHSLREGYRALVIGASGGIGQAFVQALRADPRCAEVVAISRGQPIDWDLCDEASLAALAAHVQGPVHLVVDATGALTIDGQGPEKRLQELAADRLLRSLQLNAVGPALLLRHLSPLLARGERVLWAKLSARVGSIEDNYKGGWYGYRAAKAALNQLVHTAAIELRRSRPDALCVAIHPGTVATPLTAGYVKAGLEVQTPETAAQRILGVIDALGPEDSGGFFDHKGLPVPW